MMKRKQRLPEVPPPVETESLQAARAIAAAINQGLPGNHFANIMNLMQSASVKKAAEFTLEQVIDWFKEDADARGVLDQVPTFPAFVKAFHDRAREIYPQVLA
jgi:hypothetical protein